MTGHVAGDGTGKAVCIKSDGNFGTCTDAVGGSGSDGGNEIMLRGQVQSAKRNLGVWHFSVRGDIGGDNDNLKIVRFVDSGSAPVYQDIPFVIENSSGNVGIGTTGPNSSLQVGVTLDSTRSYAQIDVESGAPPATDCDNNAEAGRMLFRSDSSLLYVCTGATGWKTY